MDKSYLSTSDNFVSPYLRRRLRPLAEVLHGDERSGLSAGLIKAGNPPESGVDGLSASVTSPSENQRTRQNCAE